MQMEQKNNETAIGISYKVLNGNQSQLKASVQ